MGIADAVKWLLRGNISKLTKFSLSPKYYRRYHLFGLHKHVCWRVSSNHGGWSREVSSVFGAKGCRDRS